MKERYYTVIYMTKENGCDTWRCQIVKADKADTAKWEVKGGEALLNHRTAWNVTVRLNKGETAEEALRTKKINALRNEIEYLERWALDYAKSGHRDWAEQYLMRATNAHKELWRLEEGR